ncbi:MAG: hypothetical protein WDN75_07655 [Bacteroidota bacterium]
MKNSSGDPTVGMIGRLPVILIPMPEHLVFVVPGQDEECNGHDERCRDSYPPRVVIKMPKATAMTIAVVAQRRGSSKPMPISS